MKKLFVIIVLAFSIFNCYSQITLDQTFPGARIDVLHLRSAGPKFYQYNYSAHTAIIYNLDYSVYKSFQFPTIANSTNYNVFLISEDLFDTDSTTLEYVLSSTDNGGNVTLYIYREDSTLLLQINTVYGIIASEYGSYSSIPYVPILNTDSGTKMIVSCIRNGAYTTEIYNLPGRARTECCLNSLTNSVVHLVNQQEVMKIYPNPFAENETIEYTLPLNSKRAELIITNLNGVEIKRYSLSAIQNKMESVTTGLAAGSYFFTIISDGNTIASKKAVKVN